MDMEKSAKSILKSMIDVRRSLLDNVQARGLPSPIPQGQFMLWWISGRNYVFAEITEYGIQVSRGQVANPDYPIENVENSSIAYTLTLVNEMLGWIV